MVNNMNAKHKFKKSSYKKQQNDEFEDMDEELQNFSKKFSSKKWFQELQNDPEDFPQVTDQILIELKDEAKKCLDADAASYNSKKTKSNSDYRWMKTIMSQGTVSDKIAAHTVSIQDNPTCNLDALRNLVSMVKVGKKKECLSVMQTLTELFLSDLLKPSQKLRPFHQRPLSLLNDLSSGNAVTRKKLLSHWYFEDQLKETYTTFVLALNTAAHDTLEVNKEKAISCMYQLLAGNPEQEKNLLTYIVNKLGDPSQKVASKTIYCLSQLLYKHWNMQAVVLAEVEKLLFRTNVATKAQYYGLCFLSQFYLSHDAPEIARKLIEVYFSFFKACIKKGEVDSRMMSALLMGVNRAYPYAKLELEKIKEHIDTMYKIVHIANFNVSLHALTLLYQVSDHSNNINDRFYSALYRKLFDVTITKSTHQAMLLNLVYKALLRDTETGRTKAFIKRLLQIALYVTPCFACGLLYLISHVIGKKPELVALLTQKSEFVDDDADEDEKYEDAKEEPEDADVKCETEEVPETEGTETTEEAKPPGEVAAGWFHRCSKSVNNGEYQPWTRNPMYAGGEFCAYVELTHLKNHYHPSVALFADNILKGEMIKYPGDPLKDFMLIRFLDRFVFKNPKKPEDLAKQGSHPTFGKRKNYVPVGLKSLAVNSIHYLSESKQKLPVDEQFMYAYLQKKMQDNENKIKEDSDLESVGSEEFEDMLEKMSGLPKDEELDFMNEIGSKLQQKSKGKEDVSDDEEMSADEESMSEDEEMDDDLDEDLSDKAFDSDEEPQINTKKKKRKGDALFASAEEFASLLEDEGSSKIAPGGSNAVSNKDNADVKQIVWEEKRNRWLKGFNKAVGKKGDFNSRGAKGGSFTRKRPNPSKFSGKHKKQKNM